MIFGGDRFLSFCTKEFLRPWRPTLPSLRAVLQLEVKEKGKERTLGLYQLAEPSPVVVPDQESPHLPNNTRNCTKVGLLSRMLSHVRGFSTILAHRQASEKDAAKWLKLLLVQLPSPAKKSTMLKVFCFLKLRLEWF